MIFLISLVGRRTDKNLFVADLFVSLHSVGLYAHRFSLPPSLLFLPPSFLPPSTGPEGEAEANHFPSQEEPAVL